MKKSNTMLVSKKDVISIDDLTNDDIYTIFLRAESFAKDIKAHSKRCPNVIAATLFYEPSTRTRLSFESAMTRLGGRLITVADKGTSSVAKGESLADTARIVSGYADIIVVRHPWEGAAKIFADYSSVPVINGGDGKHEHPTQTLCDLYTLWKAQKKKGKSTLDDLRIVIYGDLLHARAIHSLVYGLARFRAHILTIPGKGLEMPESVTKRLQRDYGAELAKAPADEVKDLVGDFDALYVTPQEPHQPALFSRTEIELSVNFQHIDALYMTRIQKERLPVSQQEKGNDYPTVNGNTLKSPSYNHAIVMHPLPRIDELSHEVDSDSRATYFEQAAYGVPVRMALMSFLLEKGNNQKEREKAHMIASRSSATGQHEYELYRSKVGLKCSNKECASIHESRWVMPEFKIVATQPLTLRCTYCDTEIQPQYVASTKSSDHILWPTSGDWELRVKNKDTMVAFSSLEEAQSQGFTTK